MCIVTNPAFAPKFTSMLKVNVYFMIYSRRKNARKRRGTEKPVPQGGVPPDVVPSAPPFELIDPNRSYVVQDSVFNEPMTQGDAAAENIYLELDDESSNKDVNQDVVPKDPKMPKSAGDEHIYHILDEEAVQKDIDAHSLGFHIYNSTGGGAKEVGEKNEESTGVLKSPTRVSNEKQPGQGLGEDVEMAENTVYNI